jgi:4-oxalocrotonate tautomerase
MPLINVKLIEDVFPSEHKEQIIERLTDAMVSIEGENMRGVTWVVVEARRAYKFERGSPAAETVERAYDDADYCRVVRA